MKTKFVWCMWPYCTLWEPNHTSFDLQSQVVLLGTQLMEYGPTQSFGFS